MNLNLIYSMWKCHFLQRDEFEIANLSSYFEPERPAFIYFILGKNRICINPKIISFTDSHIKTEFLIHNKNDIIKEQIDFKHPYHNLKEVKVVSEFPYNRFKIVDELGGFLLGEKSAYFLEGKEAYEQVKNKDLLDYEILYIGQSVLSESNVPVLKRITAHETYQKILEEYNRANPDKELFLFFLSFKQDCLIDIPDTIAQKLRNAFIENFKRNYFNSTIKEKKQNVSLLEASLINYFKPKYNSNFMVNSPSKSHQSISGLSNMNLNKVKILFGIEDFLPKLYTNKVEKKYDYEIEYNIQ